VLHDWGVVGLAFAQRAPERVERVVAIDVVPFLAGYRWHPLARAWRMPIVGELAMGFTGRTVLRRVGGLSPEHAEQVVKHFDHGTQRAILKLYRSASENLADLSEIRAPALVLWGGQDRYVDPAWARRVADALGGPAEVEVVPRAGHWPWTDAGEILQRTAQFLDIVKELTA
jgi:pimeloyl-ACP methyl ester carboxylesterase